MCKFETSKNIARKSEQIAPRSELISNSSNSFFVELSIYSKDFLDKSAFNNNTICPIHILYWFRFL